MIFISQGCTNFPGKTCWVVFSDPGIFKSIHKLLCISLMVLQSDSSSMCSVISYEICVWTHGIILATPNKASRPKGGFLKDPVKGNPLTSPVGDVSADESLFPPPVEQTGAFQQEGRGQHVTRYCRQDIHCNTHLCLLETRKPNTAIKLQILSRYSMAITRNVSQAKNELLTLFRYIIVFSVGIWSFL